jgi:hypothetical protein
VRHDLLTAEVRYTLESICETHRISSGLLEFLNLLSPIYSQLFDTRVNFEILTVLFEILTVFFEILTVFFEILTVDHRSTG